MPDNLRLRQMERNKQLSCFDWINIERGPDRIGKIRALIEGNNLTIFSINIFPEFERHGYARKVVETFKTSFIRITADRVQYNAIGFWTKMGFMNNGKGSYVYEKCDSRFSA